MPDDPTPDPKPDPTPEPDPKPDPTPPEPKPDDQLGDGGKAALEAERKARREAEKRAKAAEERAKSYEDAEKSELEKAQDRVKELEAQSLSSTAKVRKANLLAELSKPEHGLASARAALKLIEGVEFDDDDEPTNVAERVAALLEDNSFLKVGQNGGGSAANPARPGGEMTAEQVKELARKDPAKFNQLFDEGKIPAAALGG